MKRLILFIALIVLSPNGHACCSIKIGIPGLVEIGTDGVKVGQRAEGTRVEVPNCGGDICEAGKHLTGEAEKEKAEKRLAEANAQANAAQAELDHLKQALIDLDNETAKQTTDFENFKVNLGQKANQLSAQFVFYQQHQRQMLAQIEKAIAHAENVEKDLNQMHDYDGARQSKLLEVATAPSAPDEMSLAQTAIAGLGDEGAMIARSIGDYIVIRQSSRQSAEALLANLGQVTPLSLPVAALKESLRKQGTQAFALGQAAEQSMSKTKAMSDKVSGVTLQ